MVFRHYSLVVAMFALLASAACAAGLPPFPPPPSPTAAFCQNFLLSIPGDTTTPSPYCQIATALQTSMSGLTASGPSCYADMQSPVQSTSSNGVELPQPLTDLRPLPAIVDWSALSATEGASLHWYQRSVYNFQHWAPCAASNIPRQASVGYVRMPGNQAEWQRPKGWNVKSTLWLKDGTKEVGEYRPIATIMTKGKMLVVLVRGSQTKLDWAADFDWTQVPANSNELQLPGNTHAGFNKLAAYLWTIGVKAATDAEVLRGHVTHVVLTGHSLGASVAGLLAYATQNYVNKNMKLRSISKLGQVKVDAALFAPANLGDAIFTAAFDKLVNARRIQFQYDIVPMVPCAPQVTACRTTPVPTTQPDNTGLWHYSTIGGGIDFVATDMPQQPQAWALLCNLDFTQIKMFFLASHTCSYECYFSQYASDANNNCLLKSAITDGGIGTFCTGALAAFPDAATPQYPSKACLSAP